MDSIFATAVQVIVWLGDSHNIKDEKKVKLMDKAMHRLRSLDPRAEPTEKAPHLDRRIDVESKYVLCHGTLHGQTCRTILSL